MPLQLADRVQVTATANTTVSFTLGSAVTGYQSFSVITNGNTVFYGASDGTNWEVGIGTYSSSGPTLTRTTILSSSNSGSAVSTFGASVNVWIDYPSSQSVYQNGSPTFTSVTTPSVTASSTDLTLSAISTGAVKFNTLGGLQAQVSDTSSVDSYVNLSGGVGAATVSAGSASGNIDLRLDSRASGSVRFRTAGSLEQMRVSHTASAVNYVQVTGAATNNPPTFSMQGSDANISAYFVTKGTGSYSFWNNGGTTYRNVRIDGSVQAINYVDLYGSTTGNAIAFKSNGSDTNISMAFQPKGTGAIDLAAGSSGVNISNGGTVTAITRTNTGANYTSFPSIAISAPTTAGGVQAVLGFGNGMFASGATVQTGGTGYTVNDVVSVVGGTGGPATFTVTAVSAGAITTLTPLNYGTYTVLPTNPVSITGGTGSSATLNITYGIQTPTITNAGSGYIEQPTVTFSGGGGSGASAYATVGGNTTVKSLGNTMNFLAANTGIGLQVYDAGGTSGVSGGYWRFAQNYSTSGVMISSGVGAISSGGANSLLFLTNTTAQQQFAVTHTASAVNYLQLTGSSTNNRPAFTSQGSDTNIGMNIYTKGGGELVLGGNSREVFVVTPSTSAAANFLQVANAASTGSPIIKASPFSVDTNVDITFTPKGIGQVKVTNASNSILSINSTGAYGALQISSATGNNNYIFGYINNTEVGRVTMNSSNQISFATSSAATEQFRILHTASAVNYVSLYGSTTGNSGGPVIIPGGSDAAIPLTISTKSYGSLILNKNRDATNTSQYLMNNVGGLTTDGSGGAFWRGFHQGGITYTVSGVNQFIRLASYHELNSLTDPTTKNWYITLGNTTSPTNLVLANNTGAPIDFRYSSAAGSDLSFRVATPLNTDRNYLQVAGAATTLAPILSAQGSDTNISMAFQPKGTGAIDLAAGSSGVNISNGGTVTALTRTGTGALYTSFPSIAISAPTTAGGVTATASMFKMGASSATIAAGGTGYTVGDTLTISGGTPTASNATYTVATVSAGVVTSVNPLNFAEYTVLPTNPVTTTGGTGTGCTLNVTYFVPTGSWNITNAGSGYVEQPTVTFSGGGASSQATAYATVGSGTLIKSLNGTMSFNTPAGESVRINNGSFNTLTDYVELRGGSSVSGAYITVGGSTANASMYYSSKASANHQFYTNSFSQLQTAITHTASAVNYVNLTGGTTGNNGVISAQGSDSSVGLTFSAKNAGNILFQAAGGTNFETRYTATTPINYLSATGSVANFAPTLSSRGGDTNISMAVMPKGTGAFDIAAGSSGVNISNGGTVTALTVPSASIGSNYTTIPSVTISAPTTAGGVQATANAQMGLWGNPIVSGGTGYTVNDILTIVGGTFLGGTAQQLRVTSVSGGVITGTAANNFPTYTVLPSTPASVTGGTGTGATFNLTWSVYSLAITNAGSGYIEQPTVTFSGGGGSGASAYANIGSVATIKGLGLGSASKGDNIKFVGPSGVNQLELWDVGGADTWMAIQNTQYARAQFVAQGNANGQLWFSAQGSGYHSFATRGTSLVTQFRVADTASAVNYVQVTGSATGSSPRISTQGSDSLVSFGVSSKGGGDIFFQTNGSSNTGFLIKGSTTAVNYLQVAGNATTVAPVLSAQGTDTNIDLSLTTKGTGNIVGNVNSGTFTLGRDSANNAIKFTAPSGNMYIQSTGGGVILFNTGDGSPNQMRVTHTASAVNYVQVTGGATTANPVISVQGSDATRGLNFNTKGSSYFNLYNQGGTTQVFSAGGANASNGNWISVVSNALGSAPSVTSAGGDTNIDLALTPKGTGVVQFGTHTATADTAITGYIEIKDSSGTLRKLAVIT